MITPLYCEITYDVPSSLTVDQVLIETSSLVVPNEAEEADIRRATEESLMVVRGMASASRSSIEALERAIFVESLDYHSIREGQQYCMICLENINSLTRMP